VQCFTSKNSLRQQPSGEEAASEDLAKETASTSNKWGPHGETRLTVMWLEQGGKQQREIRGGGPGSQAAQLLNEWMGEWMVDG
jgi:hypothetical protein